jgi:uncharacterized SAM-dependent methyltransferase
MPNPADAVFIASSSRGLEVAKAIHSFLSPNHRCKIWNVDFPAGESVLESLLRLAAECRYAVIVLTSDDIAKIGNEEVILPNNNLIFEAGLFFGAHGRNNVAVCVQESYQSGPKVRLPSDLKGQNQIPFFLVDKNDSQALHNQIKGVAGQIEELFKRSVTPLEMHLEYGDARYTNIVVDSALHARHRKGIRTELLNRVSSEKVLPTRAFYMTEEGAERWIELTKDESYKFYRNSLHLLRDTSTDIARKISDLIETSSPDVISLGSGDGRKDHIVVSKLLDASPPSPGHERLTYYPIDYSYDLILQAIEVMSKMSADTYKIKAIVGDMHELRSFRYVYDSTPNSNLFLLLGNTLGNNDEQEIVNALNASLSPGDMALIEVNTDRNLARNDHLHSTKNLEHNAVVLMMMGLTADPQRFSLKERHGLSLCEETSTVETLYKLEGKEKRLLKIPNNVERIHISVNHRYKFEKFCDWICKTLSCEIVWEKERDHVGLVLLRKPKQG